MNISLDISREHEKSPYGGAVRLWLTLLPVPAHTNIETGLWVEAKKGINITNCTPHQFKTWLNDFSIKKSPSSLANVHRVFSLRFPNEYAQLRDNIDPRFKREYELIQSESKNDMYWAGEVDYQNKVMMDGSLTNNKVKFTTKRDGTVKLVRK